MTATAATAPATGKEFKDGIVDDLAKYWYLVSVAYIEFWGETLEVNEVYANGAATHYGVEFVKYPGSIAMINYDRPCSFRF
jgi:hypothetical protein